jgi:hypothetical protein
MIERVYNYEEIFSDIDDDPENILMTIPDDIAKILDVNPGDTLNIKLENNKLIIQKHG